MHILYLKMVFEIFPRANLALLFVCYFYNKPTQRLVHNLVLPTKIQTSSQVWIQISMQYEIGRAKIFVEFKRE